MSTPLTLAWPARPWLDLFYDLAFAAGIVAISGTYAKDHTLAGALWLAIVYALLWCTWLVTSVASGGVTRPPTRVGAVTVGVLVAQMGCVLLMALAAGETVVDSETLFDGGLGVGFLLCLILALWTRRHLRPRAWSLVLPLAGTVVAMGLAAVIPGGAGSALWLVALALIVASGAQSVRDGGVDAHRLVHRLGELTLVVLGETLVKMALSVSEAVDWRAELGAIAPVMLAIGAIWWAYFVALPSEAPAGRRRGTWVFAHLPLHLGILALAVGLAKSVIGADLQHDNALTYLVTGPLVLVLGSLAGLAWACGRPSTRRLAAGAVAATLLAFGASATEAGTPVVMWSVAAICAATAAASALRREPSSSADVEDVEARTGVAASNAQV